MTKILIDVNALKEDVNNADVVVMDKQIFNAIIDAQEVVEKRPQGECKSCRHRDPEDKKCDCGRQERQGCPFPVSDDYYCKYYEKGGADMREETENVEY